MSAALGALKARVLDAYRAGLEELDPSTLTFRALPPLPPKRARVLVIAAGKAAIGMARGALARWGARIDEGLVITTDEALAASDDAGSPRVNILRASHPIPDDRSVAAAEEALRRAGRLGRDDLLLALISGGASSLLASPPLGLSLDQKRRIVSRLLESGAPITDVNIVRRHLSRIKGGRLAEAASPARSLSLIISDVIGGAPSDVGSGPTVVDPSSVDDAARVLRARAPELAAPEILRSLSESLKPGAGSPRIRASIIADPKALAAAVARRLGARGAARVLDPEDGDAASIVRRRLEIARSLAKGEAAVIACEPTLALPERRGAGGRAGWIALAAMRDLPSDVLLLCAATDGIDGSGGAAGALVDRSSAAAASSASIDEALATFNDAPLHRALGTSLDGGATGRNFTDLHVVARSAEV